MPSPPGPRNPWAAPRHSVQYRQERATPRPRRGRGDRVLRGRPPEPARHGV